MKFQCRAEIGIHKLELLDLFQFLVMLLDPIFNRTSAGAALGA